MWSRFIRACSQSADVSCPAHAVIHGFIGSSLLVLLTQRHTIDMKPRLDTIDWRILKELQTNGNMTNVALAKRVGLTPPPCLRRVKALEEAGLIAGYFALLDEKMAGFEVTAFAQVRLHVQAEGDLRAFENRVLGWPLVRECYMVSGEMDYMLKCVATDLTAFQDFLIKELTAAPNVASVKTALTIRRAKFEAGVPIQLGQE